MFVRGEGNPPANQCVLLLQQPNRKEEGCPSLPPPLYLPLLRSPLTLSAQPPSWPGRPIPAVRDGGEGRVPGKPGHLRPAPLSRGYDHHLHPPFHLLLNTVFRPESSSFFPPFSIALLSLSPYRAVHNDKTRAGAVAVVASALL